jgi:hypothetical protein
MSYDRVCGEEARLAIAVAPLSIRGSHLTDRFLKNDIV